MVIINCILFIIKDFININKGLFCKKMYVGVIIYNIVIVVGMPVSILPALFEYIKLNYKL